MRSRFVFGSVTNVVFMTILLSGLLFAGSSASRVDASATSTKVFSPRLIVRVPGTSSAYLVTRDSCGKKFCLGFWRSTDKGTGFIRKTPPPVKVVKGSAVGSLDRLVFANLKDGFAVVGESTLKLYATTNGARSWHEVTPPRTSWYGLVVTANAILVTTDKCTQHGDSCGDFHEWRSSLKGVHWSELPQLWQTGSGAKDNYYGPSVAAFANVVWEQELSYMATYLWISHDGGEHFTRIPAPKLGSVAGCQFTPMSALELWAQCPTGMEVSFFHSSDGGVQWTHVPQSQFSGTGGGAFDPVSSEVAYLDYGLAGNGRNLVQVRGGGDRTTNVGELNCTDVSLNFTGVADGLAVCVHNYATYELLRTTDGGTQWSHVVLWGN